jgi:hypothetical protein
MELREQNMGNESKVCDLNHSVVSVFLVSRNVTVAAGVGVRLNTREAIIERSSD